MDTNRSTIPDDSRPGYGVAPSGFRLPESTRPGAVTFQVRNLERSLQFYRDLLGFTVIDKGEGTVALTGSGDTGEEVIILESQPGLLPVPTQGQLGLFHAAILLPERADLAEADHEF